MDHGVHLVGNVNVPDTELEVRVVMKDENNVIKEEQQDYMIGFQDNEEKPLVEFSCNTETDVAETYYAMCKTEQDSGTEINANVSSDETVPKAVKIEDVEEHINVLGVPEPLHRTQQEFHGQNEELNPQEPTVCRKSFTDQTQLETHQQEEHNHTLGGVHQNQDSDKKPHTCSQCWKAFRRRSDLNRHVLTHSRVKRTHKCEECGEEFAKARELKRHKPTHNAQTCHQCGETFRGMFRLNRHMRVHTPDSPHECRLCGKQFSTSSRLQIHTLTHTGERPHTCRDCGKGFSQLANLKAHMRTHTGERPFKCSRCGKGFTQKANLQSHMLTHTGEKPHECNLCRKTFALMSHLRSHMFSHSGERPHICPHCGRGFSHLSNLKTHMLTHTEKKPYNCARCGKGFIRTAQMLAHMRKKHYKCRAISRFSYCKRASGSVDTCNSNQYLPRSNNDTHL